MRFKNPKSAEAVIPSADLYNGFDYPFTAHGFTSGKNGRIGVPEWHFQNRVDLKVGDELWEVFNDGSEILRAIYDDIDKIFIPIN